jgi:ferredoxin-NADP reductase
MPYTFYDSEVVNIIDETPNTKRYFIKINSPEHFRFKAGQFVMIDLPIDSKIHTRSYSIASAPSDDNIVELLIVLKQGGLGTTYLFENIKVGSTLECSLPLGKFSLPEEIDRDICFISTGTGIAPLRSMLIDMLKTHKGHKNVYLIFW